MPCRFAASIIAAPIAVLAASPADARVVAVQAVTFTGTVPLVCTVSLGVTAVPFARGTADLGLLTERCNAARGYAVYLDPAPALRGATLIVDDRAIRLRDTAPTLIARADMPGERRRPVQLRTRAGAGGTLSVRIVPR